MPWLRDDLPEEPAITIRFIRETAALAVVLVVALFLNVQTAAAECETEVEAALRDMAIPQEDVESMKTKRRGAGGKASNNHRVDAWIRLKSCSKGYLMITMTRRCVVQESYTTGGCEMNDMPGY